ncbi:3-phosphoshikimate 1-carboxyvinyltransferase [Mesonia sp. K4-1]|jgi:3-phosphoshikimate 1-carboxyvinyltransferase|uniref:3-phosphoshikimate 1-carboxyvinyltransferase n=1 Tax=Mesonia sp. K4-1 TaxID=2602760 RepID=UPI0011CAC0C0|nr:3-phosphoshikimate 1-carboxyvinyltransferase [Mesonia sp. K4-1]TXK77063.1 3-phosphoshikimate 1-carboxyvinyltransferase [Mesonia sp. K4-1]
MDLQLHSETHQLNGKVKITGSKSESNRLLILQALQPLLKIDNISNSDDTVVLQEALKSQESIIDIHHAGTAMRFLTAYYAVQPGKTVHLTGSGRMRQRPISPLVDALKFLGAKIEYVENEGFPPLKINGQKISKQEVQIDAHISSQYISALMLVGSSFSNGLKIHLNGKITSLPYLKMTAQILEKVGVETIFEDTYIQVQSSTIKAKNIAVESDWSSASYFYSLAALSTSAEIELSTYHKSSLQGDSLLVSIYKQLGVSTTFKENSILLSKEKITTLNELRLDLNSSPDLAQTIVVTCFGLGIACHITGLHTLKIKETDRLLALENELTKLGATISVTSDSLSLAPSSQIHKNIAIKTYEDHRMAMAFAPLALKVPMVIENAEVVSKSFPDFWKNLEDFKIYHKILP